MIPLLSDSIRTLPAPGVDPLQLLSAIERSDLLGHWMVYERDGHFTVAAEPLGEVRVTALEVTSSLLGEPLDRRPTHDPLGQLGEALTDLGIADWHAYGWIGFEAGSPLPAAAAADSGRLLCYAFVPRLELVLGGGSVLVRSRDDALAERVSRFVAGFHPGDGSAAVRELPIATRDAEYEQAVRDGVESIGAGLLEKVVLSRQVPVPFPLDLCASYIAGRRVNSPARSFYLTLPDMHAAGFSPETVAEISADGTIATQPLAGTRELTGHAGTDAALAAELVSDPKEVYEHAISVRLAYAEVSGVATPDSTAVTEFMRIQRRGPVQHLASRVRGRLTAGRTCWDALRVLFPAITATGVPKDAAMRFIAEHESAPRGLYGGAVFTAAADGSLDAALVLRTMFVDGGHAYLRAGAGVVGASTPEREFTETCEKLRSVARTLVPAAGATT